MPRSTLLITMAACLLLMLAASAQARRSSSTILDLAQKNDVVFVGKVTAVVNDSVTVTVDEMLSGQLDQKAVTVSPNIMSHSVNFTVGEQALIFANKTNSSNLTIVGAGRGRIILTPDNKKTLLQAVRQLLAIAPLAEPQKNEAMLNLVRSQNATLRYEARYYIIVKLASSPLKDQYKAELVSLIMDNDPEMQIVGLQGIRFVQAQDIIPRIVELTRSQNMMVVTVASMTLAHYDTPESVAALIALTRHENPEIRMRACIDLDQSRRPEAKEALKQLLDDNDPQVRAMAPRGLVQWIRRNDADDFIPQLVAMLNDPETQVRAAAAESLGECPNPQVVPPLMAALKKGPVDTIEKRLILTALERHYCNKNSTATQAIDHDIQLIIDAMKNGGADGTASYAVSILEQSSKAEAKAALKWAAKSAALKWAVKSHPNPAMEASTKHVTSTGPAKEDIGMTKKIVIVTACVILLAAGLVAYLIWHGHATRRAYFQGLERQKSLNDMHNQETTRPPESDPNHTAK